MGVHLGYHFIFLDFTTVTVFGEVQIMNPFVIHSLQLPLTFSLLRKNILGATPFSHTVSLTILSLGGQKKYYTCKRTDIINFLYILILYF